MAAIRGIILSDHEFEFSGNGKWLIIHKFTFFALLQVIFLKTEQHLILTSRNILINLHSCAWTLLHNYTFELFLRYLGPVVQS